MINEFKLDVKKTHLILRQFDEVLNQKINKIKMEEIYEYVDNKYAPKS